MASAAAVRRRSRYSRGAAAAYCCRCLSERVRGRLRHGLRVWLLAACAAGCADRVYAAEERSRQQLVSQAASFQARLAALDEAGPV